MIKKIIYRICSYKKRVELLRRDGVIIGENCEIFGSVKFGSEPYLIKLGKNVRVTSNVQFFTHDGGLWVLRNNGKLKDADKFGMIKVGDNVHIGANAVIMPGVTIGDNVIVGVGSIVTKDIPSNSVAVGIPARVIETIDEYYEKNKDKVLFTKHMSYEEKKKYVLKNIK